jgi:hypothetical protein
MERYSPIKSKSIILATTIFVFSLSFMAAQKHTTEQIAQAQLEAYNKRDLKTFIDLFADDVSIYNFADGSKTIDGKAACEVFYRNMFALSPQLHSTLINRIVFENKAFDHESITGRFGNIEVYEVVMIYEMKEGKIFKVSVIKR